MTAPEELYRTLFERAQDAMFVADDDARYVEVNPAASALTGFSLSELLKMTVLDLTADVERQNGEAMWRAFLERGELAGEYRLRRKEGSFVEVEFRAVARVAPGRHLSIVRDITERKRLEHDREQLLAEEMRLRELQERLLGIVSHDLRTPLNAIILSAGVLRRSLAERPESRTIERILASGQRMAEIISDLRDYVRDGAGIGLGIARASMDAHELCRTVADEVRTSNPTSCVILRVEGDATGRWDARRLQQLVTNLMVNAVKHGEGAVEVLSQGNRDHWTLMVHNRGLPIPADLLPTIFDPFRSGNGGTGLGLYIVRAIVAAHDGSVEVASDERDGTTFTVRLPRHFATAAARSQLSPIPGDAT